METSPDHPAETRGRVYGQSSHSVAKFTTRSYGSYNYIAGQADGATRGVTFLMHLVIYENEPVYKKKQVTWAETSVTSCS